MKRKYMAICLLLSIAAVFLTACTGTSTTTSLNVNSVNSGSSGGSGNTVHMGQMSFIQSSVTLSKGSSLILVNDTSSVHIISNGSWVNNVAQPKQESGAPAVNQIQFDSSGQSQTVGPFTTAGTYHLYCKVHPGMTLTIIVQ